MWEKNKGTIKCEKKNKGTTKCEKRTVKCDVGTTQCEDGIFKCEEKNNGTTKCDKRADTCDVGIAQYEDETVKCEKKKKEPENVTKVLSIMMLELHNMRIEPLNVRKNKGTTKCDKITVKCYIKTA